MHVFARQPGARLLRAIGRGAAATAASGQLPAASTAGRATAATAGRLPTAATTAADVIGASSRRIETPALCRFVDGPGDREASTDEHQTKSPPRRRPEAGPWLVLGR
jgi:hypothetical protein